MTAQHKLTQNISVSQGLATLEDGSTVDLVKIQAALNFAFQSEGSNELAEASNELSKITGLQQDPHGEFLPSAISAPELKAEPEVVSNAPGLEFGMHDGKMFFSVGVQQFTLDYEPQEAEGFEFMKKCLLEAIQPVALRSTTSPSLSQKPVAFCVEFKNDSVGKTQLGHPTMDRKEAEEIAALIPSKRKVVSLFREEQTFDETSALPEAPVEAVKPVSDEHARLLDLLEKAKKLEAWEDVPEYCREDWQYEANEGDTNLGYKEWVINQIEMDLLEIEPR